jgi:hypothetical protein
LVEAKLAEARALYADATAERESLRSAATAAKAALAALEAKQKWDDELARAAAMPVRAPSRSAPRRPGPAPGDSPKAKAAADLILGWNRAERAAKQAEPADVRPHVHVSRHGSISLTPGETPLPFLRAAGQRRSQ